MNIRMSDKVDWRYAFLMEHLANARNELIKVAIVTDGEANKRANEIIDMVQKLTDEAWDTKRKELTA